MMGATPPPPSVPASRPAARQAKRRRPARRPNPWNPLPPLLVGLCFGLAYAATGRLLEGRLSGLVTLGHRFEMKAVPGTTLESLRMRYGAAAVDLLAPAPQQSVPPQPPPSVAVNASSTPASDAAALSAATGLLEPETEPKLEVKLELGPEVELELSLPSLALPEPDPLEALQSLTITLEPEQQLPPPPSSQLPAPSATVVAPPPPRR